MSSQKKIAVVLSGCGFLDGSEITEAISTLISLSELGAEAQCFAPDQDFPVAEYVESHGRKSTASAASSRNALEESARIARRHIKPLSELREKDFDGVVFPGGFGAAKNLSSWATQGAKTAVLPDVKRVITEFHRSSKPIGAICIAPTLVARVLGSEHPEVTIGEDAATAAEIEKAGAKHTKCAVDDYVSDRDHKILTTPAYMYDEAKPHEVFTGIRRMLGELVEMA
jgi:enhancing lycopene biosynthesis protein 2